MLCYVIFIIYFHCKPFAALSTPVAVVSGVRLVVQPESGFTAEGFVAQRAVVFSSHMIHLAKCVPIHKAGRIFVLLQLGIMMNKVWFSSFFPDGQHLKC